VFIVLSNKTDPRSAIAAYRRLRRLYPKWEDAIQDRARRMRAAIKPAGLATIKTKQLRAALRKIQADFGTCSLRALRSRPEHEVESYLVSLPGVSLKVAKCVMLFTMGFAVLPVDAHVHRVASRLGWTRRRRADQCHEELEALIPPRRRFAFHVDCIAHGRAVCRPREPLCQECCIRKHCDYYQSQSRLR
jgi:endonuclease-3